MGPDRNVKRNGYLCFLQLAMKRHKQKNIIFCPVTPENFSNQRGAVAMVFVSMLLISLLIALSLSNWISAQRQGGMRMQVAIKETLLAQSAFGETRYRLLTNANLRNCINNTFTYTIDRSTVTVIVDCIPFP